MIKRLFCFGVGFSGIEILKHAKENGYCVSGCVRNQEKADSINVEYDFNIIALNNLTLTNFSDITHIVMSIPPTKNSACTYANYIDFIKSAVNLRWLGYLSTTGVYGDKSGGDVDEFSPVNPTGSRGQLRVDSENYWVKNCDKSHIFRLPGIYGAGRSALDAVRQKGARAIDKAGQVFSRIHIYDIAQTVVASMNNPKTNDECLRGMAIYNVVDDEACSPINPLQFACDLLNIEHIPVVKYEDADLSPMAKSFYADNKVVVNTLIKQELGVILKYPTYKQGLQAIFDSSK